MRFNTKRVGEILEQSALHLIGTSLAIVGSILSLIGALVNNIWLDSLFARQIWMISNPIFLGYFVGVDMKYWNGQHMSTRALILTYSVFTVTNFWSLL